MAITRALKIEVANICWFMRGSVNWDQAWTLTLDERTIIAKLIRDNIDRSEKAKMPLL